MNALARFLVRHSVLLSLLLLAAGIWPLARLPQLAVDNGLDIWLDHTSPEYITYQEFQQDHGSDEWLVVGVDLKGGLTAAAKDDIGRLTAALKTVDDRAEVISIAEVDPAVAGRIGHLLLSADGRVAGILMRLPESAGTSERQGLVAKVRQALAPLADRYEFHLGGPTVLNAELDRISEHQSRLYITLAACISLLVLLGLFRSPLLVAAIIVPAGLAVSWTMGLAAGCGMKLNMISTVLPVLLWVIALTGGIHLTSQFRREYIKGEYPAVALQRAIEAVIIPYGVANLTTAAGFLSLMLSHMKPVQDLGLWSAAGLVICYFCNIILLPVLLRLVLHLRLADKLTSPATPHVVAVISRQLQRKRWWIVAIGTTALLLPLLMLPRLRTESNVLSFFRDDAPISRDYKFLSDHLTGLSTIELDFRGSPHELAPYMRQFSERLKTISNIDPVVFPAAAGLRMSIFTGEMESIAFNKLVADIRRLVAESKKGRLDIRLTGTVVLLNSLQEELVRTQVRSFCLALAIVVAVLALTFRSLPMVLTGSVVNLFPVVMLAGIAAAAGIPLNVATIMIASIAIGIAVDDTVFFLVRLRRETGAGYSKEAAVDRTFSHMVGPISATTLVVTAGFLVLSLADFKPVAYFGVLGSLTMILAWLGDIVLLPALLYCFPRSFR